MTSLVDTWPYAAFYCEENAWQALDILALHYRESAVLWILGREGQVALWNQRLASNADEPVIWDYHVVALARSDETAPWLVFDADSRLPHATRLPDYLDQTFPRGNWLPSAVQVRFRWFAGAEYRRRFESTRAHMRNETGEWQAPPPPWPCLRSREGDAVTVEILRCADHPTTPQVLTLDDLRARLDLGLDSAR